MINPSFKELEKIDKSRYALVVMTSKKARRRVNGFKNIMEKGGKNRRSKGN